MFDKLVLPAVVLGLVLLVTYTGYNDARDAKNMMPRSVTGRSAARQFTADAARKLGPNGVLAVGGGASAVCLVWMFVRARKAKLTG